jgi:hypothetical protein
MKALLVIYVVCFAWAKIPGATSLADILTSNGTLPSALVGSSYGAHVLSTLFHFEPLTLLLGLMALHLSHRIFAANDLAVEWPGMLLAAAIIHAVAAKHLGLPSVGMTAVVAAAVASDLVFRWRLSSLRLARATFVAGVGALVLSPHVDTVGVIAGGTTGAVLALLVARERKLCRLIEPGMTYPPALPPVRRMESIDEILERTRRNAA